MSQNSLKLNHTNIIGSTQCGKTTLCKKLIESIPEKKCIMLVMNNTPSGDNLVTKGLVVDEVMYDFKKHPEDMEKIENFMKSEVPDDTIKILVFDDVITKEFANSKLETIYSTARHHKTLIFSIFHGLKILSKVLRGAAQYNLVKISCYSSKDLIEFFEIDGRNSDEGKRIRELRKERDNFDFYRGRGDVELVNPNALVFVIGFQSSKEKTGITNQGSNNNNFNVVKHGHIENAKFQDNTGVTNITNNLITNNINILMTNNFNLETVNEVIEQNELEDRSELFDFMAKQKVSKQIEKDKEILRKKSINPKEWFDKHPERKEYYKKTLKRKMKEEFIHNFNNNCGIKAPLEGFIKGNKKQVMMDIFNFAIGDPRVNNQIKKITKQFAHS
jgi:hypothetical protein